MAWTSCQCWWKQRGLLTPGPPHVYQALANQSPWAKSHSPSILYGLGAFTFFKWLGKCQNKNDIIWYMKSVWNSTFSVPRKTLLKQIHAYSLTCYLWLLWCSWGVATETQWFAKPNILTLWSFPEKVCWDLVVYRKFLEDRLDSQESSTISTRWTLTIGYINEWMNK